MKPKVKNIQIKEGFYPSFVYLCPSQEIKAQSYVTKIENILISNEIEFRPVEELHLSLTKTFHPIYSEIPNIFSKCKALVKDKIINLPVILLFKEVQILDNFVVLEVEHITALRLLPIVEKIAKITNEPFYEKPIFHISLFRIQSQVSQQVLNLIKAIQVIPRRSYTLSKMRMKNGKVVYDLHA